MKFITTTMVKIFTLVFLITLVGCEKESDSLDSRKNEEVSVLSTGNFLDISKGMDISSIYISSEDGSLKAQIEYNNNPFNNTLVNFAIVKNENFLQIEELTGLKRTLEIFRTSGEDLEFNFSVGGKSINPDNSKYTFIDFLQIIKNIENVDQKIQINNTAVEKNSTKVADGEVDGTFNSVSSRCSTAEAEVQKKIDSVEGYATTSGIDCYSALFICWCSATVDLNGAGGEW